MGGFQLLAQGAHVRVVVGLGRGQPLPQPVRLGPPVSDFFLGGLPSPGRLRGFPAARFELLSRDLGLGAKPGQLRLELLHFAARVLRLGAQRVLPRAPFPEGGLELPHAAPGRLEAHPELAPAPALRLQLSGGARLLVAQGVALGRGVPEQAFQVEGARGGLHPGRPGGVDRAPGFSRLPARLFQLEQQALALGFLGLGAGGQARHLGLEGFGPIGEGGEGDRELEGAAGQARHRPEEVERRAREGPAEPAREDDRALRPARGGVPGEFRAALVGPRGKGDGEKRAEVQGGEPPMGLGECGRLRQVVQAQGGAQAHDVGEQVLARDMRLSVVEAAVGPPLPAPQHRLRGIERGGVLQQRAQGLADAPPPVRGDRARQGQEPVGDVHGWRM